MTGLYLPGAAWRPISYRAASGTFAAGKPLGYMPHVQVGNGSLFNFFNSKVSPNRLFSTAWIRKDGYSEQYCELNRIPWAQGSGNPLYHAFECEGNVNEPYTPQQINTLATWHNFLGTPDVVLTGPTGRGISAHRLGGAAWGGHSCPGDVRLAQRSAIIARARVLRGSKSAPLPPAPPVPHPPVPSGKIRLAVDGVFGPQSRMRLQQWAGVAMDSVLGPISWRAIQRKVGVKADGVPGRITWSAIQRLVGAGVDGLPGPDTYRHLQSYLNSH